MKVSTCILGIVLAAGIPTATAFGQQIERVPGVWAASDKKFGILPARDAMLFSFIFGACDGADGGHVRTDGRARLILEIDPKVFGGMVTKGDCIVLRYPREKQEPRELFVESIMLNEVGEYSWSPVVYLGPEDLQSWANASHVELTLGAGEETGFKAQRTFLLPNENRKAALTTALRDCFGKDP